MMDTRSKQANDSKPTNYNIHPPSTSRILACTEQLFRSIQYRVDAIQTLSFPPPTQNSLHSMHKGNLTNYLFLRIQLARCLELKFLQPMLQPICRRLQTISSEGNSNLLLHNSQDPQSSQHSLNFKQPTHHNTKSIVPKRLERGSEQHLMCSCNIIIIIINLSPTVHHFQILLYCYSYTKAA